MAIYFMDQNKWKKRMTRECLWFVFSVLGSSLLWYLVSFIFPDFWESLNTSRLCLLSPADNGITENRFEVIAYMDVLTIMFVYILRFTSWAKMLVKAGIKE